MNRLSISTLAALLCVCSGRAEEPGGAGSSLPRVQPGLRELVDGLTEADLDRLLPLLRENYIRADKLTDLEASRARAQGLLERIAEGARIIDAPEKKLSSDASPFRSEVVEPGVTYVRMGSITAARLNELDSLLQSLTGKSPRALLLDMRATPPSNDFETAAKICERFCPKGRVLFTIKRGTTRREQILTSREDRRFDRILAVLVDHDTAGAAEVIAAVLRTQARAMVIGQQTRGEAVEFSDIPLPSGKLLHVATAEIALPENVVIFPGGVKPDLAVQVPQEATDALLAAALEKGVKDLISEAERPRMNEAALVAGTNPEFEAFAVQRARGEKPKLPPARDAVIQRALDFVTTITIYESAK